MLARPDLGSFQRAREVGADVRQVCRALLECEQRVEARHAVGVGRRHRQAPRRVAERALADPPDPQLRGAQGGEEQVPPRPVGVRHAVTGVDRLADDGVDRLPLGLTRCRVEEIDVHQCFSRPSTRRPPRGSPSP